MTTITIERALLEKIIEKFAACGCEVCTRQSIEALRSALSAPATAPDASDRKMREQVQPVPPIVSTGSWPFGNEKDGRCSHCHRVVSAQPERKPMMDQTAHDMNLVAEKYAHKLALDLGCVLADYSGTWYETAMKTLGGYRLEMNAIHHERESPTFLGEPLISKDKP